MLKIFKRSARGAKVPHDKATAQTETRIMPVPDRVVIPMSMHIGAPALPVVEKGSPVKVGTRIGEAKGFVSAHVYSSVSGTVREIVENFSMVNGSVCQAVVIDSDKEQTLDESCRVPAVTDKKSLLAAVQACGLVGVGGAGFPTHVKLAADTVDTLIINGAECEPYLSTDTREMLECSDTVLLGIETVMKYCGIGRCIIGIEKNKPQCIELFSSLTEKMAGVEVKELPLRYPQGAEKSLIETCTGREVPKTAPSGKPGIPADCGCVVMNVTSISVLGKFLKTGIPLVSKRLTVEGDAVLTPQNLLVPIGTLYRDVVEACGGIKEGVELGKVIFGGPMMGGAAPGLDFPVLRQNNGLILLSKEAAKLPESGPCIRCGRCITACPMGLEPVFIAEAYERRDLEELEKRNADLCVACGSCTYSCPAKRLISQNTALAKGWYLKKMRERAGK